MENGFCKYTERENGLVRIRFFRITYGRTAVCGGDGWGWEAFRIVSQYFLVADLQSNW